MRLCIGMYTKDGYARCAADDIQDRIRDLKTACNQAFALKRTHPVVQAPVPAAPQAVVLGGHRMAVPLPPPAPPPPAPPPGPGQTMHIFLAPEYYFPQGS